MGCDSVHAATIANVRMSVAHGSDASVGRDGIADAEIRWATARLPIVPSDYDTRAESERRGQVTRRSTPTTARP